MTGLQAVLTNELCTLQTKRPFDVKAWAQEYFQLGSEKLQTQLTQYLALASAKEAMPQELKAATQQEQLAWLTTQALHELADFVATLLQRLSSFNVTTGHQSPEAAEEIVSQFRAGRSHSLEQWSNPSTALANIESLGTALGLTHAPCEATEAKHIIYGILAAMAIAGGKQYTSDSLEQCRKNMEEQARAMAFFCQWAFLTLLHHIADPL